jgi:shikimate dehydrogenase
VDVQKSVPTVSVKVMLDGVNETFDHLRDADLIVQCSSVGLHHGDNTALPAQAFRQGQWVYDLIYAPPLTPTLQVARQQGALIANGLGMLLYQGVASFKIWTGVQPDVTEMRKALTAALAARASGT